MNIDVKDEQGTNIFRNDGTAVDKVSALQIVIKNGYLEGRLSAPEYSLEFVVWFNGTEEVHLKFFPLKDFTPGFENSIPAQSIINGLEFSRVEMVSRIDGQEYNALSVGPSFVSPSVFNWGYFD